jgi:hypothetical protein
MAKSSSQISGVRSDPGREIRPISSSAVDVQSFVVGKYDEYGHRRASGETAGGTVEGERLKKLMQNSMQTRGGNLMPGFVMTTIGPMRELDYRRLTGQIVQPEPVAQLQPTKALRKKTKTAEAPTIALPTAQPVLPVPTLHQMLDIPKSAPQALPQPTSAKNKKVVEIIVDFGKIKLTIDEITLDDRMTILVFSHEDDIAFEPQLGGKLIISYNGAKINTMYAGKFNWYNTNQPVLIFFNDQSKNS